MSIFRRGNVYWYHFVFNGEHIQKSTKQSNRKEARQIEAAYKTALAKGEVGILKKVPAPSLREFAQRFIDAIQVRCAAKPKTVEFYAQQLKRLLDYEPLANTALDKISEELIESFVQYRIQQKVSPATVNRALATLRRLLRLSYDWKIIDRIPKISLLTGETAREFVLSYRDEETYLKIAPISLRDIAMLILDTGLRAGEALNLERKNVVFQPLKGAKFGFIHVDEGKSKNAKRNLSLTERVRAMLEDRFKNHKSEWVFPASDGTPMLVSSLDHLHAKVREFLKLSPEFVIHSLRHTYLTRIGEAAADAFTIMKLAGHSSITMSQRYVHPTPEAMEKAVERLDSMNQEALKELEKVEKKLLPATVSATSEDSVPVNH
jgi:integrase